MLVDPSERHYPWQHEGVKVASAQEILQVTGTDWVVDKTPIAGVIGLGEYTAESEYDFALVRRDRGRIVSTVKGRYAPIQNEDQAQFVLDVMKSSTATLMGGGEIGPRGVWYTVGLPDEFEFGSTESDIVFLTATVMNFHGGRSFEARFDAWREVCSNGLIAPVHGIGNSIKIAHTRNAKQRLQEVSRLLKFRDEYRLSLQSAFETLRSSKFTPAMLRRLVAKIWPEPSEDQPKAQARWENRFAEIKTVWLESDNIEEFRKTRWGAYNAITEWSQWGRTFYGAGDDEEMQETLRPQELFTGKTKDISEQAFRELMNK